MWIMYYIQGALYEKGSIISQVLLTFLLLYSVVLYVHLHLHGEYRLPALLKVLDIFLIVASFYGIIGLVTLQDTRYNPFSFWKVFLISYLPIFSYYYYTHKGYLTKKWLTIWFFIFLASVLLSYYGQQSMIIEYYNNNREGFVNNIGYRVLALIPMVVFLRNKRVELISLFVIAVFLLLSLKRGAILIGSISFLVIMLRAQNELKMKKSHIYIGATVFIIAIAYFYIYMLSTNDFVNERINNTIEGNISGRDELYGFFWNHIINETSVLHLLFGYGARGTMLLRGMMAHNDWLELGIDMGLLGVICYLAFWISFYKETRKFYIDEQCKTCLVLLLIILLGKSFFSMSYSDITIYLSCVFGYSLAAGKQLKINKGNVSSINIV